MSSLRQRAGLRACVQRGGGSGVGLWTCCGLSRATERCRDTDFHPTDLPLWRGWRGDEGVSIDVFYGVTVVFCPTSDSSSYKKRKKTYVLFQWTLNHKGQLVLFQFIKWIWASALWSRLVSDDVMPHPCQTKAPSQEKLRILSPWTMVIWPKVNKSIKSSQLMW